MAAMFLVDIAAICVWRLAMEVLRWCAWCWRPLADLVEPAHGGAFGGVAERLEFLVPGLTQGE
ncbi:hypothetical protein SAMN04487914_14035 [Arthrobacter sp. ok909]|nr:hypothetical protein SAMN04487914_14035 [Arthrobacter sp. ok909]